MEPSQTVTQQPEKGETTSKPVTDPRHQTFIDYRALGGLITDDDGIRKMTVEELATIFGVDRRQLYRWQETIPDFWGKVNDRRRELSGKTRIARVHETWYLRAVKGDFQHLQLWLANFDPEFKMPTQTIEHEAGKSIQDLANRARKMKVIESHVEDPTSNA